MRKNVGVRFITLSTLLIGSILFAITIGVAGLTFGWQMNALQRDAETISTTMHSTLVQNPNIHTAEVAAKLLGPGLYRTPLAMIYSDGITRVIVTHSAWQRNVNIPILSIRPRTDSMPIPEAQGFFGHTMVGLADAFGIATVRTHVGNIELFVRMNDPVFATEMVPNVYFFCIALLLALAISCIVGNILNRQALMPLIEVTNALERMSAGDFSLQAVPSHPGERLGRLTIAYNGAVRQVQSAFADRDRANVSMRQFIADAGHQLRTPLTVIRGYITVLGDSDPQALSEREHCLKVMRQQSLIMGTLIDNLILLDRWEQPYQSVEMDPVDVVQLLIDILDTQIEANPERRFILSANTSKSTLARLEPRELHFAITNIIDNALKYTVGDIYINVFTTASTVDISIHDEGPGMSNEVAAHAFDRFGRGIRRDVDGSGLGLTIAKRAIERAGGTISLITSEKSGSTFHICLPAYSEVTDSN